MKKIIIGVIALALVGGGGFGGYTYFMKPAEAAVSDDAHVDHASNSKKEKSHKKDGHYEFVELDPLILPVIDDSGVSQTISLVIALEVASSNDAATVKGLSPRLKDAYIQNMYGMLNHHAAMKGGVLQVDMIKEKLNSISNTVLGDDLVQDVLLQVVQQRPI